jgi:hypothetical protein
VLYLILTTLKKSFDVNSKLETHSFAYSVNKKAFLMPIKRVAFATIPHKRFSFFSIV